jgi:putative nucleotidyltransferase with HDIG domain
MDSKSIIQAADIPPVPHVLQQLLALADNPKTTSADLEKIVEREPALVAQLLKWVNSAFYSLPRRVSSISHAMILLGFSTVKSIASGMILIDVFDDLTGLSKDYVMSVWKHTLTGANLVKIIAKKEPMQKKDDLFLSAMIHDVGYLVMRQYFGNKYQELVHANPFPTVSDEGKSFEIDHAQIGAALLTEWKFPEPVIELVRNHHNPEPPEELVSDLNYLRACDYLAYQHNIEEFLSQDEDKVAPEMITMLQACGWEWADLAEQKEGIGKAIAVLDQMFS